MIFIAIIIAVILIFISFMGLLRIYIKNTYRGAYCENTINYDLEKYKSLLMDVEGLDDVLNGVETIENISEITHKISTENSYGAYPASCFHFSQLKLFLAELQFLTHCLTDRSEEHILVYVGSAPTENLSIISGMFPGIKFRHPDLLS